MHEKFILLLKIALILFLLIQLHLKDLIKCKISKFFMFFCSRYPILGGVKASRFFYFYFLIYEVIHRILFFA